MKKQLYVEKDGETWKVSVPGKNLAARIFSTKADAVTAARAQPNAQVVIRNATGQIIRVSSALKSRSDEQIRGAVLSVVRSRESGKYRASSKESAGQVATGRGGSIAAGGLVQAKARKSDVKR